MMSGDLRVLAEKYVALTGEIEDVRRAMLACLTNGGGEPPSSLSPARPASIGRGHPKAVEAAKAEEAIVDLLRTKPGSRPANWPSRAERKSRRWPSGWPAESARPSHGRRRQRMDRRVRLTPEEILDLMSPSPCGSRRGLNRSTATAGAPTCSSSNRTASTADACQSWLRRMFPMGGSPSRACAGGSREGASVAL